MEELTTACMGLIYYPIPDTSGDRVLFSINFFVCLYLCLFLCYQDYEKTAGNLHEIFREGVE